MTQREYLELGERVQRRLISAARDTSPVTGLTHNFYRYPARFSPVFVNYVIKAFTRQGDLVARSLCWWRHKLVKSHALGRHAIGVDISELAEFVSSVKTTVLTKRQLTRLAV